MSNARMPEVENFPKTGRVTEVCQEWMVREDSALAYRLQNQEFDEHLTGNKFRNAVVREDFPRAKDEQIREQRMAEQAAAIYHKMLAEQEEIDNKIAKDLADKMEREEKLKLRALELHDQAVARQLLDKERLKVEKFQQMPITGVPYSPQKPLQLPPKYESQASPHRPNPQNYQANLPRRQALAMPLPQSSTTAYEVYVDPISTSTDQFCEISSAEIYNEPYNPVHKLSDKFNRIDIDEIGLPIDEITERQIQEERDAELARKLQEQEGSLEDSLLNRDRMLAIEAQDKELAKLLQERERAKAKRARERAKQKAIAKKQQQQAEHERDANQIMPDDSYAFPADVLPNHGGNVPRTVAAHPDLYAIPNLEEEDVNYSLPADVLMNANSFKTNYGPSKTNFHGAEVKEINSMGSLNGSLLEKETGAGLPATRPTHLDLRSPLNRINKPRYPDPDVCETTSVGSSTTSPAQLTNIAMAIDPTYSRRGYRASSSYDTGSSTVTTSTSSSSPGILPPPDIAEQDDDSPVPPYMPIQGQRRTSSLEKKQKKKSKDGGCKQQ
nr:uncharacterized protein LOC111501829 [Leptinotarsa decemlineata]